MCTRGTCPTTITIHTTQATLAKLVASVSKSHLPQLIDCSFSLYLVAEILKVCSMTRLRFQCFVTKRIEKSIIWVWFVMASFLEYAQLAKKHHMFACCWTLCLSQKICFVRDVRLCTSRFTFSICSYGRLKLVQNKGI